MTGFFSFSLVQQVDLIETNDFEEILNDFLNRTQHLDLSQQKDEFIREVISWKSQGKPDDSPNLPIAIRKYRKQFKRLVNENDILYRLFYDDCGKVKYKQFWVTKTLWREIVFRFQSFKTATKTNKLSTTRKTSSLGEIKPTGLQILSHFQLFVTVSIFLLFRRFSFSPHVFYNSVETVCDRVINMASDAQQS